MTHALKTIQPYFNLVKDGTKKFELRKLDRQFKVGDILLLQEYDWQKNIYSGQEITKIITYILYTDGLFGLSKDYCILQIEDHF